MAGGDSLNTRQKRFVAAMLVAPTIEEAARQAGIAERTAYRYLNAPTVKRALSEALDNALAQATTRAVTEMSAALQTLSSIHKDKSGPTGARVSAARVILDAGPKLREAQDLSERVTALEQAGGKL